MIHRRVVASLIATVAWSTLSACGDDDGGDAERFCGEIGADPAAVVAPTLDDDAELDAALARYRRLADLAPLAIEAEFRSVLDLFELAADVAPDDPTQMQALAAQAFATERSAVAVRDWVLANCAVDLGPVGTIVPHGPAITVPPPSDG